MSTPLHLTTERLEIRDFLESDFGATHAWASDPEVTNFLSWGPNSESETRAYLDAARADRQIDPRRDYRLALVDRESRIPLGLGVLLAREPEQWELGYCLAREAWGRGLATEASRALLVFAFETLQAHRIIGRVDPRNPASAKVLTNLGFRREGHFVQDVKKYGEWRDTVMFGLLAEEFQPGVHP
ncbi:MAG: GNAT family N-acetyltransferase [Acidobacteriota bacterium]